MENNVVESGADLLSSIPADFYTDMAADTSGESAADATGNSGDEGGLDIDEEAQPAAEAGADEAGEADDEEPEPEPAAASSAATADNAEELPEGVRRGKDRNGKPGLFVEEGRWKNIYPNYQLVQQAAELFGEPVTMAALTARNDALVRNEMLFSDLESGDPTAQSKVLNEFFTEMQRAHSTGAVGRDPVPNFAKSFYETVKEQSLKGFTEIRTMAARDLAAEMFDIAARTGDKDLFNSVQHLVRAIIGVSKDNTDVAQIRDIAKLVGLPFHSAKEMEGLAKGEDPTARLRAENAALRAQVDGRNGTSQTAQFGQWVQQTSTETKAALGDAVKGSLATVEAGWKKYPDDYRRLIVEPLHRDVQAALSGDTNLNAALERLHAQAERATSAQVRADIGLKMKALITNRATQIADAKKRPVVEFAAKTLKGLSDKTHERRSDAQTRTAVNGNGGAPRRSLVPSDIRSTPDIFDPAAEMKRARQLIFG